jgi:hypothetical protein
VTTVLIARGERAIICKAAFTASRHAAVTSGETTIRPELGKKTCRSLNERIVLFTSTQNEDPPGGDLFVNGGTSLSSSIAKLSTAHTPDSLKIRGEFELQLTVRESRSRGFGASLDVQEGSMLASTLLPGA